MAELAMPGKLLSVAIKINEAEIMWDFRKIVATFETVPLFSSRVQLTYNFGYKNLFWLEEGPYKSRAAIKSNIKGHKKLLQKYYLHTYNIKKYY